MTNFTKITCNNCAAKIRPDRKSLSFIGGVGGCIGGGLGGLIGSYTIKSGNWLHGSLALFFLFAVLLGVCCLLTVKNTHFVEITENA